MPYKVEASIGAGQVMAQVPGLRHRVEEMLTGILASAEEIRRIQHIDLATTSDQPMRVYVGPYVVSYVLDLDQRCAKVVFVEQPKRERGSGT